MIIMFKFKNNLKNHRNSTTVFTNQFMRTIEQPFATSGGIYKYKGLRRRIFFSGNA